MQRHKTDASIILMALCASFAFASFCDTVFAQESAATSKQTAPALTSNSSTEDKDQRDLIDKLLTLSGEKVSLLGLPKQIVQGAAQGGGGNPEVIKIIGDSFAQDVFLNAVTDALIKNYDEKLYTSVLNMISTPLALKMVKYENQDKNQAELQAYVLNLATNPLSAERRMMIHALDEASQASEQMTSIQRMSIESMALAFAGDCPSDKEKIEAAINKNAAKTKETNKKMMQVILAYTYREASDSDLREYLKIYQSKESKTVQGIIRNAVDEKFKLGIARVGQGLKEVIAQAKQQNQSMFAKKPDCGNANSTKSDNTSKAKV